MCVIWYNLKKPNEKLGEKLKDINFGPKMTHLTHFWHKNFPLKSKAVITHFLISVIKKNFRKFQYRETFRNAHSGSQNTHFAQFGEMTHLPPILGIIRVFLKFQNSSFKPLFTAYCHQVQR